jgi:hypothetical protein
VNDPAATIASRLATQEKQALRLLGSLEDGPRTAWELVGASRGGRALDSERHPVSIPFVVLSGVLGNLDLLIAQGRVHELGRDDAAPLYRAA